MSAIKFIQSVARKSLTKNQGSGIRSIPSRMDAESEAGSIVAILQQAGLPINQLDNFIKSEADVLKFLNIIKNAKPVSTTEKASGTILPFKQKRSFAEEIEAMKKSGDIVDVDDINISEKITDREMFKKANEKFNKKYSYYKQPTVEGQMEKITGASNKIKEIQKEIDEMYRPKTDAEIKAKFEKQNKEAAERLRNKRQLTEDEYQDFLDEVGGADQLEAYNFDGTVGDSKRIIKEQKAYMADMELEYKKGNLDPKPGEANRERFLQQKFDEMEASGDQRLMTPDEIEELSSFGLQKDMDKSVKKFKEKDAKQKKTLKDFDPEDRDPNATGGRAGFQEGGLPMIDPRMNLDYNTLVEQNVDKRLQDPTFLNNIQGVNAPSGGMEFTQRPETGFPNEEKKLIEPSLQPSSLEEYLSGYEDYKAKNPNRYMGAQALVPATLPGGFDYTFNSSPHASHFNDYLRSLGLSPYERYDQKLRPEDETMVNQFKPEDMAKGGRAGFYTGGITDIEPDLSDIGHGSDSLMARTRLVSPDGQATTSTGLNYLLAEDNDNIRVPFAGGGGGRRAFLKMLGLTGAGIAGLKSGMVGLGEGGAKKAITETVKQSAGGTYPPPYFFKLVEKIKFMGDDITEKAATQEREIVKRYKDYEMTEDIGTGNIVIKKRNEGSFYDQDGIISDEYIVYKPGQADELTKGKKPPPEYDEYTVRPDSDGKLRDSEDGLDSIDEILEEVGDPDSMTLKKADGGRIGYVGGGLSKIGITGSSRKFLEKVFGKEKLQNLIENDPEMHRGLLEVAEMFRSKDKSGLVEYMQNFLPQMSKKELEAFVVGSGDTAGIEGQLIRLGSGRDYKNKIEMIEESNNLRKLKDFDIDGVSKNAEGGRIGFSGGGIFRAIIAKAAANAGKTPYEFIKKTGYKSLPPKIKMFMSKSDYEKLKFGQEEMYSNYVDMAKTRLNFQEQIEGGKNTPARELFEDMEKIMDDQSYVPKNVTDKDIAEMELMIKNRFNKGRKDNAEGGLQIMLGE